MNNNKVCCVRNKGDIHTLQYNWRFVIYENWLSTPSFVFFYDFVKKRCFQMIDSLFTSCFMELLLKPCNFDKSNITCRAGYPSYHIYPFCNM